MAKSSNDASVNNENKSYIFTSYVTRDKDRVELLIKKLEEYYEIHSMSDETKNTILKLVDSIGYAYLPDVEAQNLILEEIRSYIYRDTETIEEAYTKAMEALNQLR